MGSSYHEGITVEEINTFFGSGKFVNLNEGNYVDKDKYQKAISERDSYKTSLDELTEKTKDYDTLKTENDAFKGEKADAELKAKLKGYGIDEKAFKYVKGDINDKTLVIGDDDKANKTAVANYLKENPQFAIKGSNGGSRVITTKVVPGGNSNEDEDVNKTVNDNIRGALGRKVHID